MAHTHRGKLCERWARGEMHSSRAVDVAKRMWCYQFTALTVHGMWRLALLSARSQRKCGMVSPNTTWHAGHAYGLLLITQIDIQQNGHRECNPCDDVFTAFFETLQSDTT
eukprot:m.870510 g.870510  ORF g.870510 m.870510 type:complete len:110 (-) comp23566_c0_seq14:1525-1854(-)